MTNIAIEVDSIQGDIEDLDTVPEVINEMIHTEKIKILLVTRSRKSFLNVLSPDQWQKHYLATL
ncbi:hypothetical protein KUH03_06795 [Sphingobacterium sp. E70]|uniref:hypothetical protein n=1 Tax=Sphingobacterium sp. E70 TaxID=2853439 RepID=UPI00211CC097|nr:hypothetical protein [Sphingobacterium sp. E70]ULT26558.1 hypothetical protein KUH03_06795 [Sphingobacterium sp. E70]